MKSIMMGIYIVTIGLAFLVIYEAAPEAANRIVGLVVFLMLVPAVVFEYRWWRKNVRGS